MVETPKKRKGRPKIYTDREARIQLRVGKPKLKKFQTYCKKNGRSLSAQFEVYIDTL